MQGRRVGGEGCDIISLACEVRAGGRPGMGAGWRCDVITLPRDIIYDLSAGLAAPCQSCHQWGWGIL